MLELGRCFNWIKICPFQVETVETGSKSEKPGGSGRCPGGEGQEKNAPEIEPSDTNSDNCDETLVGISIAEPGHKIESSAARPQAQNSSAAVSRRRASRREREKVIILASKGGHPTSLRIYKLRSVGTRRSWVLSAQSPQAPMLRSLRCWTTTTR